MKIRIQCRSPRAERLLRWAEGLFLIAGCGTLGFSAWVYIQASLYQASEARLFESATRVDARAPEEEVTADPGGERVLPPVVRHPLAEGSPVSKIEIPRLGLSVVVVEGVRPRNLRLAVGHIPGTALPGDAGNIVLAGHRDTFFRKLNQIRGEDRITLTTLGGFYEYSVESIAIVEPTDVQALQPSHEPVLTLITCYPFYYVGAAPKRFIVRARQESVREAW